jgi:hypothetical protein
MSHLKAIALSLVLLLTVFLPVSGPTAAKRFHSEREATRYCPNDIVVWVNTKTRIDHLKGERWYGSTKEGAFVCRKEADAEGDRMTRNGQ